MDSIIVTGGNKLTGKVKISAAKNSVLPIIAASLLCPYECKLEDIPFLDDVCVICDVLSSIGANINFNKKNNKISIKSDNIKSIEPPMNL